MVEADWDAYASPVILQRSINISGTEDSILKWPVVDLGFMQGKVLLVKNVTLTFTRVVLWNWRKGPLFQAPGIDLIATNEETANQPWDPLYPNLRFHDMAWIQRGCMPFELGNNVTATTERPPFVPGSQSLTDALPQPGCVNSSTAPLVQRCWPMAFAYQDMVIYGQNFHGFQPSKAGYMLWLENTPVRCETVLSEECIKAYTVLGCYYKIYPNSGLPPSWPPPGVTGTGSGTQDNQHHHVNLAAVLGGVLGGVALLAAVGGALAAAVVLCRRRQRAADQHFAAAGGPGGGAVELDGARSTVALQMHAESSSSADDACSVPGRWPRRARKDVGGALDESSKGHTIRAVSGALDDKSELGTSDARGLRAAQQLSFLNALKDASSAAPVTPLSPLQPDVNLRLSLGTGEVALLPGVIGKGTFGRVVPGRYAGQQVAVKLLDYGLLLQCRGGAGGGGAGGGEAGGGGGANDHGHVFAAAAAPSAAKVSMLQVLSFDPGSQAAPAAPWHGPPEPPSSSTGMGSGGGDGGGDGHGGCAPKATLPLSTSLLDGVWQQGTETSRAAEGRGRGCLELNNENAVAGAMGCLNGGAGVGVDTCSDGGGSSGGGDEGVSGGAAVAAAVESNSQQQFPPTDILTDPGQRSLVQEVEVLARCHHPNIVRLLAACLRPPHMCLVMELMETSLDRLLYGAGPGTPLLPLSKILHIGLQVAVGLEYLHPTIMHRDLKPANVLLQNAASPTPIVKLADFGLSRLQTSVLVTANVGVGTVAYMAPETFSTVNCVVTHHVDVYALGVILWELLAGVRPWAGLDIVQIAVAVEMRCERPPLEVLSAERCPPKLRSLIQRCWDHVPARRPAAAEVVKELLQLQQMLTMTNEKMRLGSSVGWASAPPARS